MIQWLHRFILKQRISLLRADIAVSEENRSLALAKVKAIDLYTKDAWRRLRSLRAQLALIEPPQRLLDEALQGPHE